MSLLLTLAVGAMANTVTMTITDVDGVSARLEIATAKIKDYEFAVRFREAWDGQTTCAMDIATPVGSLDLADVFVDERDIAPSMIGPWTVKDPGDGTRRYSVLVTASRLRQQLTVYSAGTSAVGAVSDGAVGSDVHACLYGRGTSSGVAVLGEARGTVLARSKKGDPTIDLRARVISPVVYDRKTSTARISIETRTRSTCTPGDDTSAAIVSVKHASTIVVPLQQTREEVPLCDEIVERSAACLECVRISTVDVAVNNVGVALDLVSEFVETVAGYRFAAHFIVPSNAVCQLDGEGRGCEAVAVAAKEEAEVPVRVDAERLQSGVFLGIRMSGNEKKKMTTTREFDGMGVARDGHGDAFVWTDESTCFVLGGRRGDDEHQPPPPRMEMREMTVDVDDGRKLSMVQHGSLNDQMVRFAQARIHDLKDGSVELCFALSAVPEGSKSTVFVHWQARFPPEKDAEGPPPHQGPPELKGDGERPAGEGQGDESMKAWCQEVGGHMEEVKPEDHHHHNDKPARGGEPTGEDYMCTGVIAVTARHGTAGHDDDNNEGGHGYYTYGAGAFGVFLLIVVLAACICMCMLPLTDNGHHHHHHADLD